MAIRGVTAVYGCVWPPGITKRDIIITLAPGELSSLAVDYQMATPTPTPRAFDLNDLVAPVPAKAYFGSNFSNGDIAKEFGYNPRDYGFRDKVITEGDHRPRLMIPTKLVEMYPIFQTCRPFSKVPSWRQDIRYAYLDVWDPPVPLTADAEQTTLPTAAILSYPKSTLGGGNAAELMSPTIDLPAPLPHQTAQVIQAQTAASLPDVANIGNPQGAVSFDGLTIIPIQLGDSTQGRPQLYSLFAPSTIAIVEAGQQVTIDTRILSFGSGGTVYKVQPIPFTLDGGKISTSSTHIPVATAKPEATALDQASSRGGSQTTGIGKSLKSGSEIIHVSSNLVAIPVLILSLLSAILSNILL
jgi:hypothetical protein